MSCYSCAKPFSVFRKEKGCPSCGFSHCSKCLDNKIYLSKLNAEAKVCGKCKNTENCKRKQIIQPPDAYFKRIQNIANENENIDAGGPSNVDQQIHERLQKLKKDSENSEEEIRTRLKNIKGEIPLVSDAEIQERLTRLRGIPHISSDDKQKLIITKDTRTEQEQADDLLKQYMEQTNVDKSYDDQFNTVVNNIEQRLQNLKGNVHNNFPTQVNNVDESDEEADVMKIVEKLKAESLHETEDFPKGEELPFCEICNEDATRRCLGCKYLFCKCCFIDHKDDDDGCDKYETYSPPREP